MIRLLGVEFGRKPIPTALDVAVAEFQETEKELLAEWKEKERSTAAVTMLTGRASRLSETINELKKAHHHA